MSITPQQASGIRFAGYFCCVVAALTSINWLLSIHQDYIRDHQWPSASATVYSITEKSREVDPPSTRSRRYWVYWAEFMVILDLPPDRCPGAMISLDQNQQQCTATVNSPERRSRLDALDWIRRHPRESKLAVHFNSTTGQTAIGGESIFDLYPWDKIRLTAILLLLGALMLGIARRRLSLVDQPQTA